ncbi:telomeric repeat-binding factor 2 isoform X2 [Salmo salar]|uniref:Telomeric repeat-binding factor 2 n=1 Tax=Salmo salar TaxID=8030 RepID=B5XG60_SALSA|nr:telomeric repeat-binding factor 2 isoform X2 [Salmo salar]ACI69830.1 Telomeric repeat-binding factor 2 [Salmo salar]|eukprot:XP_013983309.1 PREDICTED: telomeric repeat-binding factor 2-like isoform X2 [Salmo salar]
MWRQKENMESGVDRGPDVECVVNRWTVDYYISVALEAFRNEQYPDFCQIRDILQCHLVRPLEANDVTPKKIRAIQFLTRINDGDKLDVSFDSQEDLTALESALSVLDSIREELPVPQKDLERVHKCIREMAAGKLMVKRQGAGQDAEEGDCPSDPQPEDHLVPTTEEKASRHKPSVPSPPPGGVQLTRSQLMAVYTALAEEQREPVTFAELEVEREVKEENAGKGSAVVDQELPLLHLSESPRCGQQRRPSG